MSQEQARLERIEHHLKLLKENDEIRGESLSNIENALIGSKMNGHKGLVSDIEEIKKTFKTQSDDITILKNDLENAKFWGKLTATGLVLGFIGLLFKLITKQ
jgi:hypothetical protein